MRDIQTRVDVMRGGVGGHDALCDEMEMWVFDRQRQLGTVQNMRVWIGIVDVELVRRCWFFLIPESQVVCIVGKSVLVREYE